MNSETFYRRQPGSCLDNGPTNLWLGKSLEDISLGFTFFQMNFLPSLRHLVQILRDMDEYEVLRAVKTSGFKVPPTLEEAVCTAAQYSVEDVGKMAHRIGVQLFSENDVIGFLLMTPDGQFRLCPRYSRAVASFFKIFAIYMILQDSCNISVQISDLAS